ncbi:beta-lactamase family protein [Polaribacter sp. R2A056_3_33]|uniref:serine hydrolase domain-containing protein n=1 Tax=Polaribacter sp. R2A056_3_33 TaxID=2745563 RepID=UPI001C4FADDF|nr:serine hydrolase domain-containing protein [Polaribacter sp. R2A056_3_33]QXP70184.1 beta-lactamase family protein [Polaribacter sp. R2A056_3_33]
MNKRKIVSGIIIILLSYLFYWAFEPYSLNPFSDKPISLSESQNHLNCNNLNSFSFKADSIINSAINKNEFLATSTAVYSEKCGNWLSTAGFLNKGNQEKPSKNSQFRIASVSKPMTAIAILQLYEKGKINLDLPIQNYLPEFPKKKKGEITIRQLLNHTSGIPHYKSDLGIFNFTHYDNCEKALEKFENRELVFKPDTEFLYSSFGYTLLGAILEKVSGKSYQTYMHENIWKPANMTNTNLEQTKTNVYIKLGNHFYRSPKNDLSYTYSGGGIQSTAEDLLKFGKGVLNYKFLNPSTTKLMIQLTNNSKEMEYTFGWDNWKSPKFGKVIEHNGTQVGSSSYFRIYFDKKVVVATLANNLNSSEEVRNLSIKLSYLLLEMEKE